MRFGSSVLAGCALLSGCYLSHERPLGGDAGARDSAPDTATPECAPPRIGPMRVDVELLSASPDGCARVGTRFERTIDLGSDRLMPECARGRVEVRPAADPCAVELAADCFGVELERYVTGTLRGPDAEGVVRVHQWFGFALAECDRQERWRRIPD